MQTKTIEKLILFLMILSFLFTTCKLNKKGTTISNDYKIEFLREILNDTINLKLISSKDICISSKGIFYSLENYRFNNEKNEIVKEKSEITYFSKILDVSDTLFIKQQIKDNEKLNLNGLSTHGFKVLDIGKHSRVDSVIKSCLIISKPIFNKSKDKAYIKKFYKSNGVTLLLVRERGKWKVSKELDNWVE